MKRYVFASPPFEYSTITGDRNTLDVLASRMKVVGNGKQEARKYHATEEATSVLQQDYSNHAQSVTLRIDHMANLLSRKVDEQPAIGDIFEH